MQLKSRSKMRITPIQTIVIGFAVLIFIGGLILKMPISSYEGVNPSFVDCLFTSTSAVCVTGLVTLDTGTTWTYFGKTIIIMLIQIGGLGFMCFATIFSLLLGKKIGFHERILMQESMNFYSVQGIVRIIRKLLVFTILIEIFGALLLSIRFIPEYGVLKGIYFSLFHSISAFCNAGFDLIGNFRSVTPYASDSIIIITLGSLIVIGGLGFTVWREIYNYKVTKKLSMYARFTLTITAGLIIIGSIMMFILEFNNPGTMGDMSLKDKVVNSTFAAVVPRTAGYNSIPLEQMTVGSKMLTVLLMFIGGSPGSTAGGIKTTTIGVVFMMAISLIRGREDTEIFKNRINKKVANRAVAIILVSALLVVITTMLLSITEPTATFEQIIFEAVSAFATVGSTLGLTSKLSILGKIIIIVTMYAGRVGVLTLVLAVAQRESPSTVKYPEGKILIG